VTSSQAQLHAGNLSVPANKGNIPDAS